MESTVFFFIISTLFANLQGELSNQDEDPLNLNNNTIWNLLKFQTNLYPQYLHGDSSLNDTIAIDEEFDHTGSQGSQEHPMEKMLEKMDKVGRRRSRATQSSEDMPAFDITVNTNVTAELGSTVYLSCRVTNLKNMTVGWIRMKDKHILTYGIYSFAHDQRFQIRHREDPDDWKLLIKHVMKKDEGPYRCQVSNGTEVLSQNFNLLVAVPTARIIGAGEIRIKQGSAISLVCVIENILTPPGVVRWYHNDEMIKYEEEESQMVEVVTDHRGKKALVKLFIPSADPIHSGNYTCKTWSATSDPVHVFVSTDGDNIVGVKQAVTQAAPNTKPFMLLLLLAYFLS